MATGRAVAVGLAAVALLIGTRRYLASASAPSTHDTSPIALSAASGASIEFRTQNGQTVGDIPAQIAQIPHLVLLRNGTLTDPRERTLAVALTGVEVPAGGITLTLTVETQHTDPDGGEGAGRIQVWRETRTLSNSTPEAQTGVAVELVHTFEHELRAGEATIRMPTDYFRYAITADSGKVLFSGDYAFLLESQATTTLAGLQETTPGAAPDALIATFCDMVPFRHTTESGTQQLRRAEVTAFVQAQLLPAMVEAIRIETNEWEFPWHEEWTSYRPEDGERLGVALGDGETWYHGLGAGDAHAGIALNVSREIAGTAYASLTDRLVSSFYHELFHNVQRDVVLHYGGHGDVAGVEGIWHFFFEGSAAAAASIGTPQTELNGQVGGGHYLLSANRFLGDQTSAGNLNTRMSETGLYASALYWRFLYEQCGGMGVIREALIALYTGGVVDIRTSADIAGALPGVIGQALAIAPCPFHTSTASVEAFARALYALSLSEGRCTILGQAGDCGLFDPAILYSRPAAARVLYDGQALTYGAPLQSQPAGIPNSYGIDFVEIDLAQTADTQPLTIELAGQPGAARFSVQVWSLTVSGSEAASAGTALTLSPDDAGRLSYTLAAIDWRTVQRLAVLIVRTDAQETADPVGAYTLTLH